MRHRRDRDLAYDQPFWRQRGWQMSAGFVLLVLCAGVITVASGGLDDSAGPPDPPARAAGQAVQDRVDGPLPDGAGVDGPRPVGCRTDDADQSVPVRPPQDVTWRQVNGAGMPLSASAGPVRESGPVLWCFAHTPMGAVMAANVIPRHMSGDEWLTVTKRQVVPGVAREIFVAMRSSQHLAAPRYTSNSIAGFALTSYSPELATVRLLIRVSPGSYAATDVTVAWHGGDWKVAVQAGGDLHTPVTVVTVLGGFVLWTV